MAGVTAERRTTGRFVLEALLRPYAQVVLSRRLGTGALILLAIATAPRLALATLAAVVIAQGTAMLLGLGREAVRDGGAACSAVLATLAAATTLDGVTPAIVALGAMLSVLAFAASAALLARLALPPLALPFVITAWTLTLVGRLLPLTTSQAVLEAPWSAIPPALLAPSWLDAPAAVLYVHGILAGALMLAAIAWHSRIALLLAAIGAVGALVAQVALRGPLTHTSLDGIATFNALLAAMVLGGVLFVPGPASLLLAAVGGAMAVVATWALSALLAPLGLPMLSLPFVLVTWLVVLATRMRQRDRHPTSALPAETPEDALERHLMRVRRFGDFTWLPFRLPFRGAWIVTQGHDGAHTHRGPWRHAFDFEMVDSTGEKYTGRGTAVDDFHCYDLPVLAAGAGTVEQVIDGIIDNPVGGVNARENWGNAVVIAHGANLYSVYAHLRPGSIGVRVGDRVHAGAELGRCGNSGRSLVPHLHFHVQRGPALGSETVPADFGDVISQGTAAAVVSHRVVPPEGAVVRPIVRDEALARALAFAPGSRWTLRDPSTQRTEDAQLEIDLLGRRVLRSELGALYLEPYDLGLVVVAFDGARESLLRWLLPALARVPFDQEGALTWTDRVPRRLLAHGAWTSLDLLMLVAPRLTDLDVTYTSRRVGRTLEVQGEGAGLRTRAAIDMGDGVHRFEIMRAGRDAVIVELAPAAPTGGAMTTSPAARSAPPAPASAVGTALAGVTPAILSALLLAGTLLSPVTAAAQAATPPVAATPDAWTTSLTLETQGDISGAREVLRQEWGNRPVYYYPALREAWLSLRLGELDEAETLYRRARAFPGALPEASLGLALALDRIGWRATRRGAYARARQVWQEAAVLSPTLKGPPAGLDIVGRDGEITPEAWVARVAAGNDASSTAMVSYVQVPLRVSPSLAIRGAFRHVSPGSISANSLFSSQNEVYAGALFDRGIVGAEVIGIGILNSGTGNRGGIALSSRLGGRAGLSLSAIAIGTDGGTNRQVVPGAFAWIGDNLVLNAGVRITDDPQLSATSALMGVTITSARATLDLKAHTGNERWAFDAAGPTILSFLAPTIRGGTATLTIPIGRRAAAFVQGQAERIPVTSLATPVITRANWFTSVGAGVRIVRDGRQLMPKGDL